MGTLISLITVDVGINVEGVQKLQSQYTWRVGFFGKKLVHNCNKRGVEGGRKFKKSINVEGGNVHGGWIFFSKSVSMTSRLLER
jgi:hypothetical protein